MTPICRAGSPAIVPTRSKGAPMHSPPTSERPIGLNHLRRGSRYLASTRHGVASGEYLGIESGHGERAILLRSPIGTVSILLQAITSIRTVAA
jgi:hypothetical protein